MRAGIVWVASVASRTARTFATMQGATSPSDSLLRSHFDRLWSDKKELLLLDGGTGEDLFRQGVPDDRKIWSATAVVNPQYHDILKQVHRSFVEAGSQTITSNSYSIVPACGFSLQDIQIHVATAGKLARESVAGTATLVLGSLGPLNESYRPDLILPHVQGVETYTVMARALSPYIDCFLAETMSSYEECIQTVDAVNRLTPAEVKPMMASFTLDSDGHLRSGETVTRGITRLLDYVKIKHQIELLAILFNCSEPEAITLALQRIHTDTDVQQLLAERDICLGAYANRLTPVEPDWTLAESEAAQAMRDDLSPQEYYDKFVSKWVHDFNVQLVGGCCGITPEHIDYIRSKLK